MVVGTLDWSLREAAESCPSIYFRRVWWFKVGDFMLKRRTKLGKVPGNKNSPINYKVSYRYTTHTDRA